MGRERAGYDPVGGVLLRLRDYAERRDRQTDRQTPDRRFNDDDDDVVVIGRI